MNKSDHKREVPAAGLGSRSLEPVREERDNPFRKETRREEDKTGKEGKENGILIYDV